MPQELYTPSLHFNRYPEQPSSPALNYEQIQTAISQVGVAYNSLKERAKSGEPVSREAPEWAWEYIPRSTENVLESEDILIRATVPYQPIGVLGKLFAKAGLKQGADVELQRYAGTRTRTGFNFGFDDPIRMAYQHLGIQVDAFDGEEEVTTLFMINTSISEEQRTHHLSGALQRETLVCREMVKTKTGGSVLGTLTIQDGSSQVTYFFHVPTGRWVMAQTGGEMSVEKQIAILSSVGIDLREKEK